MPTFFLPTKIFADFFITDYSFSRFFNFRLKLEIPTIFISGQTTYDIAFPSQHHVLFSFADLDAWFQTGSEVPPSEGNSPQNPHIV